MLVRVQDVISYCNARKERVMQQDRDSRELYAQAKARYESKFVNRLFGWKYDELSPWDRGYYYDFDFTKERLAKIDKLLAEAIYFEKLDYDLMEYTGSGYFFQWCQENDIPQVN